MAVLPQTQPNVNGEAQRLFSYLGGANQPRYPSFSPGQALGSTLFTLPQNFDGIVVAVAPPSTIPTRTLLGVGV